MVHYCENPVLNFRDLGLMARLLHFTGPLGGVVRIDVAEIAQCGPDGPAGVASAARHLEAHGYLTRERERVNGKWGACAWTVRVDNAQPAPR
jgi:hypothetical protein